MIYDHDHKFSANSGVEKKEYTTSGVKIGKNTIYQETQKTSIE